MAKDKKTRFLIALRKAWKTIVYETVMDDQASGVFECVIDDKNVVIESQVLGNIAHGVLRTPAGKRYGKDIESIIAGVEVISGPYLTTRKLIEPFEPIIDIRKAEGWDTVIFNAVTGKTSVKAAGAYKEYKDQEAELMAEISVPGENELLIEDRAREAMEIYNDLRTEVVMEIMLQRTRGIKTSLYRDLWRQLKKGNRLDKIRLLEKSLEIGQGIADLVVEYMNDELSWLDPDIFSIDEILFRKMLADDVLFEMGDWVEYDPARQYE